MHTQSIAMESQQSSLYQMNKTKKITMTKLSTFAKTPQKFQFLPLFFLLILSLATSTDVPYSLHCNDVVSEHPSSSTPLQSFRPLILRNARVTGGEDSKINPSNYYSKTLYFLARTAYPTQYDDVFKLDGVLDINRVQILGGRNRNFTNRRGLRLVHYRPPRIPVVGGSYKKEVFLTGYWNSTSGKLCMVGSASGSSGSVSPVVLKLNYLNSSNIYTSIVNGTLNGFDLDDKSAYSDPLSILGLNMMNYNYELIEKETVQNGFSGLEDLANVSLGSDVHRIVSVISSVRGLKLEYRSDCAGGKCNILGGGGGNFTRPIMVSFRKIGNLWTEGEKVRYLLVFGNGDYYNGWLLPLDPKVMLVSEGKWDKEKKRLNMVGCRIMSNEESKKSGVEDCSVRLSLRVPSRWTLRMRSAVVGEMWSSKGLNESDYFDKVELRSSSNSKADAGLTYEYREIENVSRHCMNRTLHKGNTGQYPSALSSDMRFDMVVTNKKGVKGWGYSSPVTIGDMFYRQMIYDRWKGSPLSQGTQNLSGMVNVSYVLNLGSINSIESTEISAEGLYDSSSGRLCMIGCKPVASPNGKLGSYNVTVDCDIVINIQYASLNAKSGRSAKGSIESTRIKSDPLYFEPLDISSDSIYAGQAAKSLWTMDFEITMVLVSNTLTCLFVGLQLLHVKKNASVLPLVSVVMLTVLTLAHMIPLLLNFEALFLANRNRQSFYFGSDGWLEVNEVLVRVITMIAFLLEFRLLQLTWSARGEDSNLKSVWISDKKVLYLSLPLYIGGGLISWLVYVSGKSNRMPYRSLRYQHLQKQSLWGGLKSYAGLILDAFLLPQVVFNIFCDSREKVLAPPFYVGTTLVRLLPHAYDLYRAHSSSWSFSYIYANPRMDYYSTAWDIIISVVGLILVLLIFLQQRFGGRCFLPNRFRPSSVYQKVPAVSSDQL